jgi:hypothetical protein
VWNRRPTSLLPQPEVSLGAAVQQHHGARRVEDELRRGRGDEGGLRRPAQRRLPALPADGQGGEAPGARTVARPEDALRQADRREELRLRQQHLRLAEQQQAVLVQGEGEPLEHARLRVGGEVHEHVAARQQHDPGDRGVLQQVVPPEDERRPQVGPEAQQRAVGLEVGRPLLGVRPARSSGR